MKNKKIYRLSILLIILLISLSTVLYFGSQKAAYHEDEYYSFYSSNFTNGWNLPDNGRLTNEDILHELTVSKGEGFNYGLVKLVQSWDVHPPLYYWILHTVCSLTPDIFSKWQGIGINIAAYLASIVFFYLSTSIIFDGQNRHSSILALIFTAIFALNPAIISSVMFIRMYSILTLFIQISLFLHLKAWKEKLYTNATILIPLMFTVYCGFMTHYYFLMFQFFLSAIVCVLLLYRERSIKKVFIYGTCMVIPLIAGYLTYPSCLGQMFRGQRGAEATSNFFDLSNTFDRLNAFFSLTNDFLFSGVILVFAAFLMVSFCICKRRKYDFAVGIILGATILGYCFVISKTALILGDTSVRYILPVFGTIILFMFWFLSGLINSTLHVVKKSVIYFFVCLLLVINMFSVYSDKSKILFLYRDDAQHVEYAKSHKDVPVIYIYSQVNSWFAWESADEFLVYDDVYFVTNDSEEAINDEKISSSSSVIAYICGQSEEEITPQIKRILNSNHNLSTYTVVFKEKFCMVIEIK